MVTQHGLQGLTAWFEPRPCQLLALPSQGKRLHLSRPQFPRQENGHHNGSSQHCREHRCHICHIKCLERCRHGVSALKAILIIMKYSPPFGCNDLQTQPPPKGTSQPSPRQRASPLETPPLVHSLLHFLSPSVLYSGRKLSPVHHAVERAIYCLFHGLARPLIKGS